jgi:hypothetical protein
LGKIVVGKPAEKGPPVAGTYVDGKIMLKYNNRNGVSV